MKTLEKRTKIVATLGPASASPETLESLLQAGVNVLRLNFSHSDPDAAKSAVEMIRAAREKLHLPIAIMADIRGPAVRMYGYAAPIPLEAGTLLRIESRPSEGIEALVAPAPLTVYTNLPDVDALCAIG
jgi:pyruvate kinase